MKVAEAMTQGIDLIDPSATVQEAATRMAELDVGAVFIGGDGGIMGVMTDRDILVRVVVEGKNPGDVRVSEVMTPDVVGCKADDSIETAFAAMRENQFRRMPVLDEAGKMLGVVTLSDLAKSVESPEKLAEAVRELSEPHRSREEPEADEEKTEGGDETNSGEPPLVAAESA